MGASYVAVPAAIVETDYPDDWTIRWYFDDAFPGPPFPPGYDPEYDLNLVAPAYMYVGYAVSGISTTCTDRGDFDTSEPTGSCIYTASLLSDGSAVQLKLSGGGSWLSAVEDTFAITGSSWGSNPGGFEFNVAVGDIDDYIVLVASAVIADFPVEDSVNIEIKEPLPITCTLTTVIDYTIQDPIPTDETVSTLSQITSDANQSTPLTVPYAYAYYFDSDTPDSLDIYSEAYDSEDVFGTRIEILAGDPWELGQSAAKTHVIEGIDLFAVGRTYYVGTDHFKNANAVGTYITTLKVYLNEELSFEATVSGSLPVTAQPSTVVPIWTINGETGAVTTL